MIRVLSPPRRRRSVRWFGLMLSLVVSVGCREAASPKEFAMVDLEALRWHNRVVLVFGSSADDAAVIEQRRWLVEHVDAVAERDLVVGYVFEDAPGSMGDAVLPVADARTLADRFEVPPGAFRFVLIGKDGGVKRTADTPVSADDLFRQIDAMPMRQREMRDR